MAKREEPGCARAAEEVALALRRGRGGLGRKIGPSRQIGVLAPLIAKYEKLGGGVGPSRRLGALQLRKRNAILLPRQGRLQGRARASGNFRISRGPRARYDIVLRSAGKRTACKPQQRYLRFLVGAPALSMGSAVRRAVPIFILPVFQSKDGIYDENGRSPIMRCAGTERMGYGI